MKTLRVQCCIAGGGPAGLMLGYLLARAGVKVLVLEKHADFLRDFRGDTIHPSTLEILHDLGLAEEFLKRPHQKTPVLRGWVGSTQLTMGDFSHLPVHYPFIAFVPQWDFLNFLHDHARAFPSFDLLHQAEVTDLLREKGRIAGLRVQTPTGEIEVRADLVVGADGRQSIVRARAGLPILEVGAPIDVLWMKIPRAPDHPDMTFGRFDQGQIVAMLNRQTYWQCAYVIPKGEAENIKAKGLPAFRSNLVMSLPFLAPQIEEVKTWDDVKLLTVRVDRLKEWSRPGLLCIGDAAHAMSPVGGVGINLAIQDAVATANGLAIALKGSAVTHDDLKKIQKRREWPTQVTQAMQVFVQNNIFRRALSGEAWTSLPWPLKIVRALPALARIPGRLVGMGVRPERPNAAILDLK